MTDADYAAYFRKLGALADARGYGPLYQSTKAAAALRAAALEAGTRALAAYVASPPYFSSLTGFPGEPTKDMDR